MHVEYRFIQFISVNYYASRQHPLHRRAVQVPPADREDHARVRGQAAEGQELRRGEPGVSLQASQDCWQGDGEPDQPGDTLFFSREEGIR